jgi:hypothetical protein
MMNKDKLNSEPIGFAMLIKELFENQSLLKDVTQTEKEVKKETEREQTVDWMTRWLQEQSRLGTCQSYEGISSMG